MKSLSELPQDSYECISSWPRRRLDADDDADSDTLESAVRSAAHGLLSGAAAQREGARFGAWGVRVRR